MDFTTLTIDILKMLSIAGGYGVGIILLTIVIRLAMWPLGVSQQRSMRTMQLLQPKMKAIQERYKSNPQVMQQKMMEFYKEHKFNPMAGCFPLLIQMPIFILLYSTLMSPQFIQMAGDSQFLFIKRLDATLKTSAGVSHDGILGVSKYDTFMTGKTAKVYFKDGEEPKMGVKIEKPNRAIEVQGELTPGESVDFKISLDNLNLKFSELDNIERAEIDVMDVQTKETEMINFVRKDGILTASVPTKAVETAFHWDVLLLIALFAVTMVFSQKAMMAMNKNAQQDPAQAAMQKSMNTFMPIMLTFTFVIIPIPAGVLLYLISSNCFQVLQTIIINKKLEAEDAAKSKKIDDVDVTNAKRIQEK
ncbi:MAG: membrane protein insertase YidC [Cyanobacteria bacterium SIG28]|nr:membrane protein insertase YidC [Cyanobacteria bacterium SIG28]